MGTTLLSRTLVRLCGAVVCVLAASADAGVIGFNDFSGNASNYDFSSGANNEDPLPSQSGLSFNGAWLDTSPRFFVNDFAGTNESGDNNQLYNPDIEFLFDAPVTRFVTHVGKLNHQTISFSAYLGDSLVASYSWAPYTERAWVGREDFGGFDKVVLHNSDYGGLMEFRQLRFESVNLVPLPPAAWMGLGLLVGLGALSRVRRDRLP